MKIKIGDLFLTNKGKVFKSNSTYEFDLTTGMMIPASPFSSNNGLHMVHTRNIKEKISKQKYPEMFL